MTSTPHRIAGHHAAGDRAARPALRRLGLAGLAATAALALSACAGGGGAESAGEAWNGARTQFEQAESFRMTADLPKDALQDGATSGTLEAAGMTGEPNGQLTMHMKADQGELTMEMREVGEKGYVRMDLSGQDLDQNAKAMMGLGDKWIEQDIPQDQSGMIGSLRESLLAKVPAAGALDGVDEQPQEVDHDGQKAYRYEIPADIAEAAAQKAKGDTGASDAKDQGEAALSELDMSRLHAFVVDADGRLLAFELQGDKGKDGKDAPASEMAFSDWGSVTKFQAPAKDEIRDLTGGGQG